MPSRDFVCPQRQENKNPLAINQGVGSSFGRPQSRNSRLGADTLLLHGELPGLDAEDFQILAG